MFVTLRDFKTLKFLHTTKIKPVKANATFLYPLETSGNHKLLMQYGPEMD